LFTFLLRYGGFSDLDSPSQRIHLAFYKKIHIKHRKFIIPFVKTFEDSIIIMVIIKSAPRNSKIVTWLSTSRHYSHAVDNNADFSTAINDKKAIN